MQGKEKDHAVQQLRLINNDSKVLFKQIQFYRTYGLAVGKSAKKLGVVTNTVHDVCTFVLTKHTEYQTRRHETLIKDLKK